MRLVAALVLLLAGARPGGPGGAARQRSAAIVVLVSIDGFRYDYLDSLELPNLRRLAREGVRARWMAPVFPTQTFPNHYTIATGLYPAHHGIVSNSFVDPSDGARFRYTDSAAVRQSRWWGGEPLWATAIRQGQRAATMYWVGSEAAIGGVQPTLWKPWDPPAGRLSGEARVDTVLAWLALPDSLRPELVTLYFNDVDNEAHRSGPLSPAMNRVADSVDRWIGRLTAGIGRLGLTSRVNIIVVSDHGHVRLGENEVVVLDDFVERNSVDALNLGSFIALSPRHGSADSIAVALAAAPHAHVYTQGHVPAGWHYEGNPRIAPIVGVMDAGWSLTTRSALAAGGRERAGDHGYDNSEPTMRATFIAAGPAFRRGIVAQPFQNVHVYELVCAILGLAPAPNDGSLDSVRALLR